MKVSGNWLRAPATQAVFDALEAAGIDGFFVGGCVRNALLGAPVADIDIATAATPDQVATAAQMAGLKCVPTGIDHGTVTIVSGGLPHEITTFRRDIATDGRRAEVAFSASMEQDAARRDFTMNALYADRHGEVNDPLGGLPDLEARRVRFIGRAEDRIAEDYLRILRFFRFHAWYGDPAGGLDADGLAACADGLDGLAQLSGERIGAEMSKLLMAPDPAASMAAMAASGVLARVMPGADATALPVLVHLEDGLAPRLGRRVACLGGEDVKDSWRLANVVASEIEILRELVGAITALPEIAYRQNSDCARDVALLRAALFEQPLLETIEADIAKGARAVFPISAKDLMPDLQGPELGAKLRRLETRWIASGFTLTKAELL